MSRVFTGVNDNFLQAAFSNTTTPVEYTILLWTNYSVFTAGAHAFTFSGGSSNWPVLYTGEAGDPLYFIARDNVSHPRWSPIANTWHPHIIRWSSADGFNYISDASNEGGALSETFFNNDKTGFRLGANHINTDSPTGKLAHAAMWNRRLSDAEAAALNAGANPNSISATGRVFYYPLTDASLDNVWTPAATYTAGALAVTGAVAVDANDNPPVSLASPVIESSTVAAGISTNGSVTIAYPSNIQAGNLLILRLSAFGNGPATFIPPSGFISFYELLGDRSTAFAMRIADGTENGNITAALEPLGEVVAELYNISNHAVSTPEDLIFDALTGVDTNPDGTTRSPALSSLRAHSLVLVSLFHKPGPAGAAAFPVNVSPIYNQGWDDDYTYIQAGYQTNVSGDTGIYIWPDNPGGVVTSTIAIPSPAAQVTRYVNTNSTAGGDGTTNATTGVNRAYATIQAAIEASAKNLVASNEIIRFVCEGLADSSYVGGDLNSASWVMGPDNYIIIEAAPGHEATTQWDDNKYRINVIGAIGNPPGNTSFRKVIFKSIQLLQDTDRQVFGGDNITKNPHEVIYDSVYFRKTGGSLTWFEMVPAGSETNVNFINTILHQTSGTPPDRVLQGRFELRNVTIICETALAALQGQVSGVGEILGKNVIVINNGVGADLGTDIDVLSEAIVTSDATSPNGVAYQNQTVSFVSPTDFALALSDIGAKGKGINLTNDPSYPFSTDINGSLRSSTEPWDVGAAQIRGLYLNWQNNIVANTYTLSSPETPENFSFSTGGTTHTFVEIYNQKFLATTDVWNSGLSIALPESAHISYMGGSILMLIDPMQVTAGKLFQMGNMGGSAQAIQLNFTDGDLGVYMSWINGWGAYAQGTLGPAPTVPFWVWLKLNPANAVTTERLKAKTWLMGAPIPADWTVMVSGGDSATAANFSVYENLLFLGDGREIGVGTLTLSTNIEEDFVPLISSTDSLTSRNRRAPITIQASQVPSLLSDFPLLLTDASLPSEMFDADGLYSAQNGGGDIRFSLDAEGLNRLPCEVVSFVTNNDPALGSAEIWVKVPSVSASVNTTIYVWYNTEVIDTQPIVTDSYGRDAVWADYEGVWHLGEDGIDRTGNLHDLTWVGTPTIESGIFGNAAQFSSGVGAHTQPGGSLNTSPNLTASVWLKINGTQSQDPYARVFDLGGYNTSDGGISLERNANTNFWNLVTWGANSASTSIDTLAWPSVGVWTKYEIATNTITPSIETYQNGVDQLFGSTATRGNALTELAFNMANYNLTPDSLTDISIGKFLLRKEQVSADWVSAEYNNQSDPATFAIDEAPVHSTQPIQPTLTQQQVDEEFGTSEWHEITLSNAIQAGNTLVVMAVCRGDGTQVTDPTIDGVGWTRVLFNNIEPANTTFRRQSVVFTKIAGESEPTTVRITFATPQSITLQAMTVFQEWVSLGAFKSATGYDNGITANEWTLDYGPIATAENDSVLAFMAVKNNSSNPAIPITWHWDTGFTETINIHAAANNHITLGASMGTVAANAAYAPQLAFSSSNVTNNGLLGGLLVFYPFVATGGIVNDIDVNGTMYRTHTFLESGTFEVLSGSVDVEYLIVAGGGSGGAAPGGYAGEGGGGAGGFRKFIAGELNNSEVSAATLPVGTYPVVIGLGGVSTSTVPSSGSDSSFNGIVSIGGGRGAGEGDDPPAGTNGLPAGSGGSGGGGAFNLGTGGAGTAGQGFAGATVTQANGGGGGGASEIGFAITAAPGRFDGGDGLPTAISGISTYYAGGGGGGYPTWTTTTAGLGGLGGGGAGSSDNLAGTSAINNTGGGGGGASGGGRAGGNGGSGIVILRYPLEAVASGFVITDVTDGVDRIFTIGQTGIITTGSGFGSAPV